MEKKLSKFRVLTDLVLISAVAAVILSAVGSPATRGINVAPWGAKWIVANLAYGFAFFSILFIPTLIIGLFITRKSLDRSNYSTYRKAVICGICGVLILSYGLI